MINCRSATQASSCVNWLTSYSETAEVQCHSWMWTFWPFLFFQEKIASVRSEPDSQPADGTPTPHAFVGAELCGFVPVSQELVRKLIKITWFCPQRLCSRSNPDHLVENVLSWLSAFDVQNCERITVVWVCSSAVQGGSLEPRLKKKREREKKRVIDVNSYI